MLLLIILAILYLIAGYFFMSLSDTYYLIDYRIIKCILGTIFWLPLVIIECYRNDWRI